LGLVSSVSTALVGVAVAVELLNVLHRALALFRAAAVEERDAPALRLRCLNDGGAEETSAAKDQQALARAGKHGGSDTKS